VAVAGGNPLPVPEPTQPVWQPAPPAEPDVVTAATPVVPVQVSQPRDGISPVIPLGDAPAEAVTRPLAVVESHPIEEDDETTMANGSFLGLPPAELAPKVTEQVPTVTATTQAPVKAGAAIDARTGATGPESSHTIVTASNKAGKGDKSAKADKASKTAGTGKAAGAGVGGNAADGKSDVTRKRLPGPAQWAIEIAVWVVAALILSTLLRLFVVQLFLVPSESMYNTLQDNDRIAVLKFQHFQRGDIVVFADPGDWLPAPAAPIGTAHRILEKIGLLASTDQQYLVKRVIGLPGDHVTCCTDGKLSINGVTIDESSYLMGSSGPASDFSFDVTVPVGRVFVLGDNREHSSDSRYHLCQNNTQGFGMDAFVPITNIVGPVKAVVLPFNRIGSRPTPTSVFASVPSGTDPPPTVAKVQVGNDGPGGPCNS